MEQSSKFHATWSQVLRFKRSLAMIAVVAFMLFGTGALHNMSSRSDTNPEAIFEARSAISQIERDTGITVKYEAPYTLADGSRPTLPNTPLTYELVDLTYLPVIARGVEKAVSPYPPSFLQKYCSLVFISGTLEIDSTAVSGTYGPKWIIISVEQDLDFNAKVTEMALQETFHHECASQVYTTDAGAILGFTSLRPKDSVVAQNIRDLVVQAEKPAPHPSTGYLNIYATTTPSNDFSEYAKYIFARPKQMRKLASQHAKVREKLNIVMSSYERANPEFKEYFNAQGLIETDR